MSDEHHWKNTPRTTALEYTKDVIRACRDAGASPSYKHLTTIQDKLFEETHLPRLRVLQILNKMQEARIAEKSEVTLTIEETAIILQAAREFK